MERWKINLYTLWVTQVFSLMGFGLALPFIPFYLQELGMTDPVQLNIYVGLASTIPAAAMAVAAPVWGIVSDRYGRKMMIMRAMLAASVILLLMGMAGSVMQFMVLRACQGIFTGTITASMAFVSANTPENRMSFALGFMTSSNFLGYSIGPFIGGLIAEAVGYKICFMFGSGFMLVGFMLVVFLVKEDRNSYGQYIEKKVDSQGKKVRKFNSFIIACLIMLLVAKIARTVFNPFIPLFVQETLGTVTGGATYTGIINGATGLATAVAALTITRLGDVWDKYKLVFLLTVVSLPVTIFLAPSKNLIVFTILFALFFFIAGGIEPVLTSMASASTTAGARGALFGIIGTVNSLAMMFAPMIGSAVSIRFSLRTVLVMIPVLTGVQVVLLLCFRKKNQQHQEDLE